MPGTHKPMPYEKKKAWVGFGFIAAWLFGFLFFFLKPTISSLVYSFCKVNMLEEGGYTLEFLGLTNYVEALTLNKEYPRLLVEALGKMVYEVPAILVFSLFIAVILNQKFRGRMLARAVFFLPVIVATGVVMKVLDGDIYNASMEAGAKNATLFSTNALGDFLAQAGIDEKIVNFLTNLSDNVFQLTWQSGVQILLFIAGLQTVSTEMYEAASMEGATAWESFWKITFPMLSPTLVLNVVYTIISSFTDYSNYLMVYIRDQGRALRLSDTAAYSWMYFLIVAGILAVVYALVNRSAYYENG